MTIGEVRVRRDSVWQISVPVLARYQHLCALMIMDCGPGLYYQHEVSDPKTASLDTVRCLFMVEALAA